jgi:hypothetical protein
LGFVQILFIYKNQKGVFENAATVATAAYCQSITTWSLETVNGSGLLPKRAKTRLVGNQMGRKKSSVHYHGKKPRRSGVFDSPTR